MQMTIFGFVVCCHEVCRLLSDECLSHRRFNSTFIFLEAPPAPPQLRGPNDSARPPPQSCLGREMQNQMLHWIKEAQWKDLL